MTPVPVLSCSLASTAKVAQATENTVWNAVAKNATTGPSAFLTGTQEQSGTSIRSVLSERGAFKR